MSIPIFLGLFLVSVVSYRLAWHFPKKEKLFCIISLILSFVSLFLVLFGGINYLVQDSGITIIDDDYDDLVSIFVVAGIIVHLLNLKALINDLKNWWNEDLNTHFTLSILTASVILYFIYYFLGIEPIMAHGALLYT
ncbi:hypothetical protein [Cytobacillus sp. IB215665]|uniref:hypothetical protein n=1 Tax=Cytobacillus sp. IB215665 TaxID=3097357 RepID=UPI002A10E1DD|nr:hypothetical protein [Cytobacillus sp. IB215665]MDX8367175.1 hypothetical protein [Cytobacillus sp. IB215665]